MTHINYAFADIKNGEIAIFDDWAATGIAFGEPWDSPYKGCLGQFKKLKQQYPNTTTLISVGGWSRSAEFHNVAATQASREKFARSVVAFIRQWGFDGVDIDWEYPTFYRVGDTVDNPNDLGTPYATPDEKHTFTLLMQTLRATLDQAGSEDGRYYSLTTAVGAGKDKIEQTEPDLYAQYVDFINVMTYDMHGAFEGITGHQSPLYFNPDAEQAYRAYYETLYTDPAEVEANVALMKKYTTDEAMKQFLAYGIPSEKLVVGSPFYSRGWSTVQNNGPIPELPGLYATCASKNATGTYGSQGIWDGGRYAGVNPYYHLKGMEQDASFQKYRDPISKVPYLYSESKGEMYTYEDTISLQERINYVNDNQYGGIIFWEVTGDYVPSTGTNKGGVGELVNILYNGLIGQ